MITRTLRTLLLSILLASALSAASPAAQPNDSNKVPTNHNEETVAQLQAEMASGKLTSEDLTKYYIERILMLDQNGPGVNAVIELNPDALDIARKMDKLRKHGIVLGPLHGIPVLVEGQRRYRRQDADQSAGSFALVGLPAVA